LVEKAPVCIDIYEQDILFILACNLALAIFHYLGPKPPVSLPTGSVGGNLTTMTDDFGDLRRAAWEDEAVMAAVTVLFIRQDGV
jgi:hypothetical protein